MLPAVTAISVTINSVHNQLPHDKIITIHLCTLIKSFARLISYFNIQVTFYYKYLLLDTVSPVYNYFMYQLAVGGCRHWNLILLLLVKCCLFLHWKTCNHLWKQVCICIKPNNSNLIIDHFVYLCRDVLKWKYKYLGHVICSSMRDD